MSEGNRPYTLEELKALPEGARVWMELRIGSTHTGWNTVTEDGLADSRCEIAYDNALFAVYAQNWRAWPAPPSVEDKCKYPWPEVPHD